MTKQAEAPPTDLAVVSPAGRELMAALDIRFADPEEVQLEIAGRLATAQTPEELFGDTGPLGLRQHLGRPFYVKQVRYLPGRFEAGLGFYALITGEDAATGEPLAFTSGATNVLIQLARAAQMGWLDKPVTAEQTEQPTANGYHPYRLRFA